MIRTKLLALLVCSCPAFAARVAPQAEFDGHYFVSPDGSDANPGTLEAPFATVAQAQARVREIKPTYPGEIVVNLRGGIYRPTAPIQLTPEDSGAPGARIVYQAYGFGTPQQETPIISGGQPVTGTWTLVDPTIDLWHVPASPGLQTRQLYVNGRRAVRACRDQGIPGSPTYVPNVGYTTTDPVVMSWGNPQDIEFVYRGKYLGNGAAWSESRCGVDEISEDEVEGLYLITMDQPGFDNGTKPRQGKEIRFPNFMENALEFLDEPGEWYHDQDEALLYYIPLPGENMATAEVIVPVLEGLLDAQGQLGDPVHHISFLGISFMHATWLMPSTGEGLLEGQANYLFIGNYHTGNHSARMPVPGSVSFEYAQDIRIERCRFQHLGAQGLVFEYDIQDNEIVGNVFTDISGTGLRLGRPTRTIPAMEINQGNVVENNYIHHAPVEFRGGVGLQVVFAKDMVVRHNDIGHTPYSGISFGWGWVPRPTSYAQNNAITHNHIHDVMQLLKDGAAVYTLNDQGSPGNRTVVSNNYLHDVVNLNGGLYFDESSSYIDADSNVIAQLNGNNWLFIWTSSITNITVTNSFVDTTRPAHNFGGANVFVQLPIIKFPDTPWPAAAQNIIHAAGLEPAYQDLLTQP